MFSNHKLMSNQQLDVAYALTDIQFAKITDATVAAKLKALRNQVWKLPDENKSAQEIKDEKNEVFRLAIDGLNSGQIALLCESYARMGSLYELAGLTARDNFFAEVKKSGTPIAGGMEEFLAMDKNRNDDCKTILTKLGMPVFEPVLTMHPTNVKALPTMQALRQVAQALKVHNPVRINQAIAHYQATPILHEVNGEKKNLTVRDETMTVLNFLGNIYEDLPFIFKQYDDPLSAKFKSDYQPLDLLLDTRFGSWGSAGDKDGNNNVTAEKTLEAIARHTHDIVERYLHDLESMDNTSLDDWKGRLGIALRKLQKLLGKSEQLTDATDAMRAGKSGDSKALSREFDALSNALADIRKELDAKEFESNLTGIYRKIESSDAKEAGKILELIRKVRWFGFNFSKIEYREQAGEYAKVVGELIPGYLDLTPAERAAELTKLLNQQELPQDIFDKVAAIAKAGTRKALTDTSDNQAIAYHTLKRLQLASDHRGIIKDNVLAECGIIDADNPTSEEVVAQGLSNLLEAQFLQRAVEDKSKGRKPALLGIVPLFEDPSTMQNIDHIMRAAYENSAYAKHMEKLADDRYDGIKTQQLQIAHSDNRRRAGSLAGTAFIHEAHKKFRALNEEYDIATQFFQGGSLSDAFRNGVRSITAQVNAFGMHDFAKFTFQGGDLLNYFNHPGSNERVFTRFFTHAATRVQKNTAGEWFVGRDGNNDQAFQNGTLRDRRPNEVIEEVASEALKMTREDYSKNDFTKDALGTLYAALGLGFKREAEAANRGSRANSRTAFAKIADTAAGVIVAMDPNNVRTIPFSAFPQFNNIVPSPVGGLRLDEYVKTSILQRLDSLKDKQDLSAEEQFFVDNFGDIPKHMVVQPKHMALLYDKSPTFRDAMDKTAFAVARSDLEMVEADIKPKFMAQTDDNIMKRGLSYILRLKETFKKMGNIVYESILGTPQNDGADYLQPLGHINRLQFGRNQPSHFLRHDGGENPTIQAAAMEALNGLGADIWLKNNYQDFITYAKHELNSQGKMDDNDLLATMIAGALNVTHGRWPKGDDPAYARQLREMEQRQQSTARAV